MKKVSKFIAVACAAGALFLTTNVNAQTTTTTTTPNPWRFGIGVEGGIPTGNASNTSSFELGATARLQYDAGEHFAWTLTSGYYNFFGKDMAGGGPNYGSTGIVPVKVGFKTFFASSLYFGGEVGAGFETQTGGETKLILAPTLGWANKTWDIGARYENFSGQGNNFGLAGLRVAYAFGL